VAGGVREAYEKFEDESEKIVNLSDFEAELQKLKDLDEKQLLQTAKQRKSKEGGQYKMKSQRKIEKMKKVSSSRNKLSSNSPSRIDGGEGSPSRNNLPSRFR